MLTWMVTFFIVCDTTLCASCSIRLLIVPVRWWRCRFLLRWRCTVAMMWRLKRWHIIHVAVTFAVGNIIAATITTTCGMLLLHIIVPIYWWKFRGKTHACTHTHDDSKNQTRAQNKRNEQDKFRLMAMLLLRAFVTCCLDRPKASGASDIFFFVAHNWCSK